MKKNYLTLLSFMFIAIGSFALPVDKEQAKAIALHFMKEKGWEMAVAEPVSCRPFSKKAKEANHLQPLYVFNASDNKGFVVISGDDATESILGYCDDNSFNIDSIPDNLMGWLVGTEEQIEYVRRNNITTVQGSNERNPISPLVKSKWGQDSPYNADCPVVNGTKTPTGCLATALAQVMYYHRWPQSPTTSIPGYSTPTYNVYMEELPSTTFDWTNMKDSYRSSNSAPAVAELMRYVGQSLEMDYTPGASGAHNYYVPWLLSSYFNYPTNCIYLERDDLSIAEWDDVVYNELVHQRPILYCGYTPNWEGHAFVCDGYNGNGMYHINWGWNGSYDGYYRLSVLNPGTTTQTGAASTEDGFSVGQSIILGIQPTAADDILPIPWPIIDFSVSQSKVTTKFRAMDYGSYYGALVTPNDDGTFTPVTSKSTFTVSYYYSKTFVSNIKDLPVGTINLYPAICPVNGDDTDWILLGSGYYYLEVTTDEDNNTTIVEHPVFGIEVEDLTFSSKAATGLSKEVSVTLVNNGDMYDGNLYLFSGDDNSVSQTDYIEVSMLPGEKLTFSKRVKLTSGIDQRICISRSQKGGDWLFDQTYYGYDISLDSYTVEWDPIVVRVTLKNNSDLDYNYPITAVCYAEGVSKAVGTIDKNVPIPAGETIELEYKMKLDTSKKYYMVLQHINNEVLHIKTEIPERVYIDYAAAGIEPVVVPNEKTPSYNLLGQPVTSAYKGIVIKGGRKSVNK